jgi:imidazolonepropionase
MHLLRNIGILATCREAGGQGALHPISRAAVVWDGGTIVWVGAESDLPSEFRHVSALDAHGRLVVPGLIDCHTHLAFGGWRADEFTQRIEGKTYQEIAQRGGGIVSTVAKTRAMSAADLLDRCRRFAGDIVRTGVTTIECKSGYGLDRDTEIKLLQVYHSLRNDKVLDVVATFLGAHVVPVEFRDNREGYISFLLDEMLPRVATQGLASFCDVFVEAGAFSIEESRRILTRASELGLGRKLHADQLTSGGGAELAVEVGATSADHLECISDTGIARMAESQVVAVSLPIASLYLNHPPLPARRLIQAGVPVAVATDFNPGSAPSHHLPLAMMLGCTLQKMTPNEVLKGVTLYAARAIGLEKRAGSIEVGKRADLAVIDASDVTQWMYHFRANACLMTIGGGAVRYQAAAM